MDSSKLFAFYSAEAVASCVVHPFTVVTVDGGVHTASLLESSPAHPTARWPDLECLGEVAGNFAETVTTFDPRIIAIGVYIYEKSKFRFIGYDNGFLVRGAKDVFVAMGPNAKPLPSDTWQAACVIDLDPSDPECFDTILAACSHFPDGND